jgi:hypothetical protein
MSNPAVSRGFMKRLCIPLVLAVSGTASAADRGAKLDFAVEGIVRNHWPAMHADPQNASLSVEQFRALTYWLLLADSFGSCEDYAESGDKDAWLRSFGRIGLDTILGARFHDTGIRIYADARTVGLTDHTPAKNRAAECAADLALARQKLIERITLPGQP